jgi:uncharacterized protein (TIGR03032 family)
MNAAPALTPSPIGPPSQPWIEVLGSRRSASWLAEQNVSLAFTTYQAGKLFLVGRQGPDRLGVFERTFNRCMGLCVAGSTIWMGTKFQLWRLENALRPGQVHDGYDALYVPRVGYSTGDLDVHDLAMESNGRVLFVSTAFSCLATLRVCPIRGRRPPTMGYANPTIPQRSDR